MLAMFEQFTQLEQQVTGDVETTPTLQKQSDNYNYQ